MRIAIITSGVMPIPATQGGAIACLVENLMRVNETEEKIEFSIFCAFDREAYAKSKSFKHTRCVYYKVPLLCRWLDKLLYLLIKGCLKKNTSTYRILVSRLYMIMMYVLKFDVDEFDKIVLLSNPTLFVLLKFKKFRDVSEKILYYAHNEIRSLFHCTKEVRGISGFLCVSQFISNSIKQTYPSLSDCKSFVLKNCIDTSVFTKVPSEKVFRYHEILGITKDDFVIVFAGRLSEEKGALETIRAVKLLPKRIKYKLLIVGNSFFSTDVINPYVSQVKMEAEEIKERIVMTGFVKYEDMPAIYKLGQVAVLPSIWEEPAGLTMLEAAISGTPLITTCSGGIPEYIPASAAVFLEKNTSLVSNIANAIQQIHDNEDLRRSLKGEGAALTKVYNLQNYYNNFVEIMKCY